MTDNADQILKQITANPGKYLIQAQLDMEAAIHAHKIAGELLAEATMEYKAKKGQVVKRLKSEGFPVSIIPDMAGGEAAEEKKMQIEADSERRTAGNWIQAYQYKIDIIKKIASNGDNLLKRS